MRQGTTTKQAILLYVPNLIGYFRAILIIIAWLLPNTQERVFLALYVVSIALDGVDGWAARKLNQVSAFGAWLDVVVDLFSRQLLWSTVLRSRAWMIVAVEWLVFVCTHQLGAAWKSSESLPVNPPSYVSNTMKNGFKSPLGVFAIAGLHVLPIWLFMMENGLATNMFAGLHPTTPFHQQIVLWFLILGRIWCFVVEAWFIRHHVNQLLSVDVTPQPA